jgi:hypothetical protein
MNTTQPNSIATPPPEIAAAPLRERVAHAIELLLALPEQPTRDELVPMIAALEAVRVISEISVLWRCPRCRAEPWAPCERPSGDEMQRGFHRKPAFHAPRIDRGLAGLRSILPNAWRGDLVDDVPKAERTVARQIRNGVLVKHLMRLRASGLA